MHLAFTGILARPRREAARAAKRAGAIVHGMPSIKTSVVVRGRPNAQQAAGKEAGLNLMEIKRLRAKGHRITLLEEGQFWRLAARRQVGRRLPRVDLGAFPRPPIHLEESVMNAEQAAAIVQLLTGTIESEAAGTRKVFNAVPHDNRHYKPDPKSRTAWDLAVHTAISDVWFADSILNGKFEWTGEPPTPAEMTDPAAVAKWHETQMADRVAKLRAMSPEQMLREVEFFGTKAPACTWLVLMNNHAVHHRGQLAAYLRAAGSKVPAIYGMSADENAFG